MNHLAREFSWSFPVKKFLEHQSNRVFSQERQEGESSSSPYLEEHPIEWLACQMPNLPWAIQKIVDWVQIQKYSRIVTIRQLQPIQPYFHLDYTLDSISERYDPSILSLLSDLTYFHTSTRSIGFLRNHASYRAHADACSREYNILVSPYRLISTWPHCSNSTA